MVHWDPEVNGVFLDALDISEPAERRRYLDRKCQGNAKLRSHVERLLAANERAGDFLEDPPTDVFEAGEEIEVPEFKPAELGSNIGLYRLLEGIGEGGFGTVYLAEQREPVQRRVALKIIKPGMDTRQVITRFEAERQALAMMDHPNICRVLDCGATEAQSPLGAGRPYFVMELVKGVPITRYCDEGQLETRDRLALFADVCHAVQHAHQKGVIHRDLKPSNILVTRIDAEGSASGPRGIPKIIDFGIAKAVEGRLTDKTLLTEQRQLLGTPAYMSPEQAGLANLDIDTRSDIYSLGVLLYEMLTGTTPFDAQTLLSAGYDDMRRIIREVEPPKPSTRLSSIATTGHQQSIGHPLRGDLDWIVMKCLEKDRTRRYETASALAADVQRHLTGEPVVAAPPSRLYRLSKTFRRHRTSVVVAAGFALVVAGALVATSTLWQRESNQRARAEAINTFLKHMLTAAEPAKTKGEKLTVRESLDMAAKEIDDGAMRKQPLVEAEIRCTIGSTYFSLGLFQQAETQFRAADAIQTRELGDQHVETLRTRSRLAEVLSWMTVYAEAVPLAESTLAAQTRMLGVEHPDTQQTTLILGQLLPWADSSRFTEAEALLKSVLECRERTLGKGHIETARAMHLLGEAYTVNECPEKAEPLEREALRIHSQVLGPEHPETLETEYVLARALITDDRSTEAEPILRRLLETRGRIQGPDHLGTLGAMEMLGAALNTQQRYLEAEPLLREKLVALQRTVGPDHQDNVSTRLNLASCLKGQDRHAEAEAMLREALNVSLRCYGPEHPDTTIRSMVALARSLELQGKNAEAAQIARQVLEIHRRQKSSLPVWQLSSSIQILKRLGQSDEALKLEQELIAFALAAARAPDASAQNLNRAARCLLFTEFTALRDAPLAIELATEANRRTDSRNPVFLHTLAQAYVCSGDSTRAKEAWERAFAQQTDERVRSAKMNSAAWWLLSLPPDEPRDSRLALEFALQSDELSGGTNPAYLDTLALAYQQTGDTARAVESQKKALSLLAADAPDRADYEARLREFQAASKQ